MSGVVTVLLAQPHGPERWEAPLKQIVNGIHVTITLSELKRYLDEGNRVFACRLGYNDDILASVEILP